MVDHTHGATAEFAGNFVTTRFGERWHLLQAWVESSLAGDFSNDIDNASAAFYAATTGNVHPYAYLEASGQIFMRSMRLGYYWSGLAT